MLDMKISYSMPYRVTSYDCDPSRRLRLSVILQLIQEVAGRHLDGEGNSYEKMTAEGYAFLLTREVLRINEQPKYNEELLVETWYRQTKGVQFLRDVCISDKSGRHLIEASGAWVLVDPNSHKILRPSVFPLEIEKTAPCEGLVAIEKLNLPKELIHAGSRLVRWSDIDCNGHMNNAVYADIVCDFYPNGMKGREIHEFNISFLGEALEGSEIEVSTDEVEGKVYFEGKTLGKSCFEATIQ
jgi:acyl-ACP thioesterase